MIFVYAYCIRARVCVCAHISLYSLFTDDICAFNMYIMTVVQPRDKLFHSGPNGCPSGRLRGFPWDLEVLRSYLLNFGLVIYQ